MLRHTSILASEIYQNLPSSIENYFDGTFGHGGHVEYILSHLSEENRLPLPKVIACDIDKKILTKGLEFTSARTDYITPELDTYANIDQITEKYGLFDFMLLDLGVNMEHFKDAERGFSIKTDAPLDMRFRNDAKIQAKDIVNEYTRLELEKMLITYGDFSPKTSEYITKGIVDSRAKQPIQTTFQLSNILKSLHFNQKKIAVIFQVLRIETNQELIQLEIFLKKFCNCLKGGGRCDIITFHSIEDRMVKLAFKALSEEGIIKLINKKVIQPHYTEIQRNKAARSAKLRIVEKL
ncbi:ribosomal RNA small subunit methyltransferase H [candidate division SR1 bacterium]|nr:ribosomal RNA small subunit methyltransferase H [candidate division SR1 bacterium]